MVKSIPLAIGCWMGLYASAASGEEWIYPPGDNGNWSPEAVEICEAHQLVPGTTCTPDIVAQYVIDHLGELYSEITWCCGGDFDPHKFQTMPCDESDDLPTEMSPPE